MRINGNGLASVWKQFKTNFKMRARLRRQHAAKARSLHQKYVSPDQLAYADLLDIGVKLGRVALGGMFLIYVLGFVAPKVPLSELHHYWSTPASQYASSTGVGMGWSWLTLVGHGDYLNLLGIAFLLSLTIACCARVLPFSFRRRDFSFSTIVLLQILLLLLAASGLLEIAH